MRRITPVRLVSSHDTPTSCGSTDRKFRSPLPATARGATTTQDGGRDRVASPFWWAVESGVESPSGGAFPVAIG